MKTQNIIVGVIFIAMVTGFIYFTASKTVSFRMKENDFIKDDIAGVLVEVRNIKRGNCVLRIKQSKSEEIHQYTLTINWFVKKNHIEVNDSIVKKAGERIIEFYKKRNGKYEKCCEEIY